MARQTRTAQFYVDCIEIFPTNQPANASLVRASRVEDPESYDGIDGLSKRGGKQRPGRFCAAFTLRERLYFVKEHSLHVTQDDGTNEPALWSIAEVSHAVGTPSVRGVGIGEDWVVIAHRTGLYLFNGGEPIKISQEIQPTWNQINWQYGQTLWVTVDTKERRIFVGVPLGTATTPNQILMLDYRDLDYRRRSYRPAAHQHHLHRPQNRHGQNPQMVAMDYRGQLLRHHRARKRHRGRGHGRR